MPEPGALSVLAPLETSAPVAGQGELRARGRRAPVQNILAGVIFAVVAAALAWFFVFQTSASAETSQRVSLMAGASGPAPRVGEPAPDFRLLALDGQPVELGALRGHPVWLTFWATWCPPCRTEAPDIQAAFETYRDQGLVVVAVDVGEGPGTVRDYVNRIGLTFTVAGDPGTEVAAAYRVSGLPTHIFIDADGIVRDIRLGILTAKVARQEIADILRPAR